MGNSDPFVSRVGNEHDETPHATDLPSARSIPSLLDSPERTSITKFSTDPSALAFAVLKRATRKSLQTFPKANKKPYYGLKDAIVACCYLILLELKEDEQTSKHYDDYVSLNLEDDVKGFVETKMSGGVVDFKRWVLIDSCEKELFEEIYYVLERHDQWPLPPPVQKLQRLSVCSLRGKKVLIKRGRASSHGKEDTNSFSQVTDDMHGQSGLPEPPTPKRAKIDNNKEVHVVKKPLTEVKP